MNGPTEPTGQGAQITLLGYDEAAMISPEQVAAVMARSRIDWVEFTPEGKDETMLDETAPPPQVETDPAGPPPRALSNDVNHRHFHPSYMRVGVRIDGEERSDLKWYDCAAGRAITTAGVMIKSEAIEPFWRYPENRQQRRARERWEAKHGKAS